jgi:hypothetical protein
MYSTASTVLAPLLAKLTACSNGSFFTQERYLSALSTIWGPRDEWLGRQSTLHSAPHLTLATSLALSAVRPMVVVRLPLALTLLLASTTVDEAVAT